MGVLWNDADGSDDDILLILLLLFVWNGKNTWFIDLAVFWDVRLFCNEESINIKNFNLILFIYS